MQLASSQRWSIVFSEGFYIQSRTHYTSKHSWTVEYEKIFSRSKCCISFEANATYIMQGYRCKLLYHPVLIKEQMREFRRPGDRNPPGETRTEIFYFLLDYPDGVDEYTVRWHICRTLSIRDPRSVRNQLEGLRKDRRATHESEVWRVPPFDVDSFPLFWGGLDFETKLRVLPKRMVQDYIEEQIYPDFVNRLKYAPFGFYKRIRRLEPAAGDGHFLPSRYDEDERPFSNQEGDIILTAFKTMPTLVDYRLNTRPEVDLMVFILVDALARRHPEKERIYFTPGYFGLLYTLVVRLCFLKDLAASDVLSDQVKNDYSFWFSVPFMEEFDGAIPNDDHFEIVEIFVTLGEFTHSLMDRYKDDENTPGWDTPEEEIVGRSKKQIEEREKHRHAAGKRWELLAREWPGRGVAPGLQVDG